MSFPHSWLITGFVTRLTRWVPIVEQELLTLPEHLSSSPVINGVRVTQSLVLCVCFVDRCLSFCHFLFGHCVVWPSSIYGFWIPFWYIQTLLTIIKPKIDLFASENKFNITLLSTIIPHQTEVRTHKNKIIPGNINVQY
jgi:hypothetical protein